MGKISSFFTVQEQSDLQHLNNEIDRVAGEVWREMQTRKTLPQLQEAYKKETTRSTQDFLLKLMADHPDHPNAKKV